ncbi:MAG: EAL domain-containing protein, partial [Candidatus Izemoplasmatales bacterium]|nr:EAL domain-containing protein [Candidatus Izemoplasmatales bacterium]
DLQSYLSDSTELNLEGVEQLLLRIVSNKPQYSSIEFLNLSGQQVIWMNRIGGEIQFTESESLLSRSDEEYFNVANTLTNQELYILPIFFDNISGFSVPMTGLVMPVYDSNDDKQGYLVLNYNANFLLSIFDEYVNEQSEFIEIGILIDGDIWEVTDNFNNLLLNQSENTDYLYSDDERIIKSDILLSEILDGSIKNEDDFYQIYAVIDFDGVIDEFGGFILKNNYMVYVFNFFSIIVILYVAWLLKSKSDDRILLNANMYLSDRNNDGVLITNDAAEITYVNEAFEEIYGYKSSEIRGQKPSKVLGLINYGIKGSVMKTKEVFQKNVWNIAKSGILILKNLSIKPETNASQNIKHYLAIYSEPSIDIDNLAFSSNYDAIETYKLFAKAFENEEMKTNKSCFMAIRTFNEKSKKIYGNFSSKNLSPYAFAEFLKDNLSPDYKIAVPIANYLIVYVSLETIGDTIEEMAEKITDLIEKYKRQPNINNDLEYNFGIALADNFAITRADIIENAFVALQMSKSLKNIKHLIYSEDVKKIIKREKDIYSQIEHGFNYDEFYMQYQIQKDVVNNTFTGVEALLRWNNSVLGNVSPAIFIPIIENSFYINRLSQMVLGKVIKDFLPYINYMNPDFRISINLTSFDFFNEQIINSLVKLIKDSPIPSKNFCFEITESGYLENKEKTNSIIDYLHKENIIVAIDDFGTGFSSLDVLKNLHVDKIKIDRSFIKDYPDKDDGAIFKTIVNLVKTMNMGIIVEGTETQEQINFIKEAGCEVVQGYFVSQPIYIENLARKFLNKKSDF